jgi:DNA-binding HxlR family transcriptional regulator/peroxiredoxin
VGRSDLAGADCAIAQALDVVGDPWTLLVVRDVARGFQRFDELQAELRISRRLLTERLRLLTEHGVLRRERYLQRPPRYEYRLTDAGRGLLPVLVALQNWGSAWVLGDGSTSATTAPDSAEARRVHDLTGTRVPPLSLPAASGGLADPVADTAWTVLYCYPGGSVPGGALEPPGWNDIPGAVGCTLEACTYRDQSAEFAARDATVLGVSTQRADEQARFATAHRLTFPLLSDATLELATALRLPTFRAAGTDRLKRLTLVVDSTRTIRRVVYPIPDVTGSVVEALDALDALPPAGQTGSG